MNNVKPDRPPKTKGPPLVYDNSWEAKQNNFEPEFWWNKFLLCLAIAFGVAIGYSIGINAG